MLQAFAEYERARRAVSSQHAIVGVLPGTRLQRIVRLEYGWRLWIATRDFIHGSFIECHDNGMIVRFEARPDEGDETILIRPTDEEIHAKAQESNRTRQPPSDLDR